MFQILRHYGIPNQIVQAIRVTYINSRSSVVVNGTATKEFDVKSGVLQGDTLAPLLFIIVLDYVMKNAVHDAAIEHNTHGFLTNHRVGTRSREVTPATYVNDLDFADDIALLENSQTACQNQLSSTSKRSNEVGLKINYEKTQIITNQPSSNTKITVDGQNIEIVENFKYLGSMMLSSESDFKTRENETNLAIKSSTNQTQSENI